MIVWSGVLSEADAERVVGEEVEQWQFEAADVHLVCSPLQHSAPIRFALNSLLAGGSVVLPGPFSVDGVVDAVAAHGVTTAFCTPAHLQRLDDARCLAALASLRLVAHAGAPCPESLKRRAIDAVGVTRLWEFYGSTEGQFTVCASGDWLQRPGTVGRARTGRSLEVDGDGAVWCHTPVWARWEYWRDPERTAAAWRRDAFTVGDLGRLDDDGFLFLSGRRSDLIITGGVNVYPAEVEQALGELRGVEDVVVFGRPDERWGQRVCAAVVGAVTVDQVMSFAAGRLAPYKRPKEVHLVTEIPRVGLAKVRRHLLAAQLGLE
jgi:long-chain acyl-CoA synthetase